MRYKKVDNISFYYDQDQDRFFIIFSHKEKEKTKYITLILRQSMITESETPPNFFNQ